MIEVKAKRQLIVFVVAVMMLAAAIIYFDTRLLDHVKQASRQQENLADEEAGDTAGILEPGVPPEDEEASGEDQETEEDGADAGERKKNLLIFRENVTVRYNTPEYDSALIFARTGTTRLSSGCVITGTAQASLLSSTRSRYPNLRASLENRGDEDRETDSRKAVRDRIHSLKKTGRMR